MVPRRSWDRELLGLLLLLLLKLALALALVTQLLPPALVLLPEVPELPKLPALLELRPELGADAAEAPPPAAAASSSTARCPCPYVAAGAIDPAHAAALEAAAAEMLPCTALQALPRASPVPFSSPRRACDVHRRRSLTGL